MVRATTYRLRPSDILFVRDIIRNMRSRWDFHFCERSVFAVSQMKLCRLEVNIKLISNVWLEGSRGFHGRVFESERRSGVMTGLGENEVADLDRAVGRDVIARLVVFGLDTDDSASNDQILVDGELEGADIIQPDLDRTLEEELLVVFPDRRDLLDPFPEPETQAEFDLSALCCDDPEGPRLTFTDLHRPVIVLRRFEVLSYQTVRVAPFLV